MTDALVQSKALRPDGATHVAGGRNRVSTRALTSLISGLVADELHVDADRVRVELADHVGALWATVHTPIGVPSLTSGDAVTAARGTLLDRCARAQSMLHARVVELTGYRLAQVTLRLTGAHTVRERRVA